MLPFKPMWLGIANKDTMINTLFIGSVMKSYYIFEIYFNAIKTNQKAFSIADIKHVTVK